MKLKVPTICFTAGTKKIGDLPKQPDTPPKGPTTVPSSSAPPAKVNFNIFDAPSGIQTPYPNSGFIMQSLNYIQMDVFSSAFSGTASSYQAPVTHGRKVTPSLLLREPAVITGTLHAIENEFKSLF